MGRSGLAGLHPRGQLEKLPLTKRRLGGVCHPLIGVRLGAGPDWTISYEACLAYSPITGRCILSQAWRTGLKSSELSPSAAKKVGDVAWQKP